jgi:hypothetical protein
MKKNILCGRSSASNFVDIIEGMILPFTLVVIQYMDGA